MREASVDVPLIKGFATAGVAVIDIDFELGLINGLHILEVQVKGALDADTGSIAVQFPLVVGAVIVVLVRDIDLAVYRRALIRQCDGRCGNQCADSCCKQLFFHSLSLQIRSLPISIEFVGPTMRIEYE